MQNFGGRHAPVLFPIVREIEKMGNIAIMTKLIKWADTVFARDNDFELIKKSADELVFELRDNEDSLNHYPFPFCFPCFL